MQTLAVRLAIAVLLVLPATCLAGGEGKEFVPEGFVPLEPVGKINIYVPRKDFLPSDACKKLRSGLKEIYDVYATKYRIDQEVFRPGTQGGLYTDTKREAVALVLFPDQASYDDWLGATGTGGITCHLVHYVSVVGVPLKDGQITAEEWGVLWHELSHVFYFHFIWMSRPLWLNEGLSEYFRLSNSRVKRTDIPSYAKTLDALRERREKGQSEEIDALLRLGADQFGREQYDDAWVLVDLLMSNAPDVVNRLLAMLTWLDQQAWADPDGVEATMNDLAAQYVEAAVGGKEKVQVAWEKHRDFILANPNTPRKYLVHVGVPKGDDPGCTLEVALVNNQRAPDGTLEAVGTVKYHAPWDAKLMVICTEQDAEGKWAKESPILEELEVDPGRSLTLSGLCVPDLPGARAASATAIWAPSTGGVFRTRIVWNLR